MNNQIRLLLFALVAAQTMIVTSVAVGEMREGDLGRRKESIDHSSKKSAFETSRLNQAKLRVLDRKSVRGRRLVASTYTEFYPSSTSLNQPTFNPDDYPTSLTVTDAYNILCRPNACIDGGNCWVTNVGPYENRTYTCSCMLGLETTLSLCGELRADVCAPNPCKNGGICSLKRNLADGDLYKCECVNGFEGPDCGNSTTNPCDSNPCMNGGNCSINTNITDGDMVFTCECEVGYEGTTCEEAVVDPCEAHPCVNGYCRPNEAEEEGFQCVCNNGFKGLTCAETDSNPCVPNPCVNEYCLLHAAGQGGFRCIPAADLYEYKDSITDFPYYDNTPTTDNTYNIPAIPNIPVIPVEKNVSRPGAGGIDVGGGVNITISSSAGADGSLQVEGDSVEAVITVLDTYMKSHPDAVLMPGHSCSAAVQLVAPCNTTLTMDYGLQITSNGLMTYEMETDLCPYGCKLTITFEGDFLMYANEPRGGGKALVWAGGNYGEGAYGVLLPDGNFLVMSQDYRIQFKALKDPPPIDTRCATETLPISIY